jgi:hypothetical protein
LIPISVPHKAHSPNLETTSHTQPQRLMWDVAKQTPPTPLTKLFHTSLPPILISHWLVVMNFSHSRPHHDTILLQQWIKSKMNESFD